MTIEELKNEISQIVGVDSTVLQPDSGPDSIPEWDSMAAISIVSFLDRLADSPIESEEANGITSFGAIITFVRNRGKLDN